MNRIKKIMKKYNLRVPRINNHYVNKFSYEIVLGQNDFFVTDGKVTRATALNKINKIVDANYVIAYHGDSDGVVEEIYFIDFNSSHSKVVNKVAVRLQEILETAENQKANSNLEDAWMMGLESGLLNF